MLDTPQLPDDKGELAQVIDAHVNREETRLTYRRLMWLLAFYYLNGARTFTVFEPTTGRIRPAFVDSQGNLEYQSQELMVQINRTVSRLCTSNLAPRVVTQGTSLQGQRERGVAQLLLDATIGTDQVRKVQRDFATVYATLGCCGITGHIVDHPTIGLTTDLEVVHPTQVFPFPSTGTNHTQAHGIIRQRMVPIEGLKERYGKKVAANLDKMQYFELNHGEPLQDVEGSPSSILNAYGTPLLPTRGGGLHTSPKGEMQRVVKIREVWINGPRGTLSRYCVTSGGYVLEDRDLTGIETYCPLGWARFYESGTFHGLGLFDALFPISRQGEKLVKQLFQNIADTDKYGVVVIPGGQWSERAQLRPVAPGLKVLPWEPDPMAEGFRPFNITPFNTGDMPGKVAQFARTIMSDLSPLKDLSAEKGRVDSMSGLSLLDESLSQPLAGATQNLETAFSTMYRGVTANLSSTLAQSPRPVPVTRLSLDLAGVMIDPSSDQVSFPDNPLPDISRLSFRAVEATPRSQAAKKQEALTLMEKGVQDAVAFKLYCIEEGVELAAWIDDDKASVETCKRNLLLLFNDGQTPQQVIITPDTSKADVQLRVVSAFMQRPIVGQASVEVQNALIAYRGSLMQMMQSVLPPGVPTPEDASMMSQMRPPLSLAQ